MTDKNKDNKNIKSEDESSKEEAVNNNEATTATTEAVSSEAEAMPKNEKANNKDKDSDELEEALDKFKKDYLLLAADFENYKKRSRTDFEARLKFAAQPLALSVVDSVDNLELAIKHIIDKDNIDSNLAQGLKLSLQSFLEALLNNHITPIKAEGEMFNPSLHEAVSVLETDQFKSNQIVNVIKKGYLIHDRLLRPAIVQVAKEKK